MSQELQRLRRRVDELEELLGLNEAVSSHFLDCADQLHRGRVEVIVRLLATRTMISETSIGLAIGCDGFSRKSASVYVHYARRAMRCYGLAGIVKTDWGRGWYVEGKDKPRLRQLMAGQLPRSAA